MSNIRVSFDDLRVGSLTWTLPLDAKAVTEAVAPEVRQQFLDACNSNLGVFCAAMLRSYDNPAVAETINIIMREIHEIHHDAPNFVP